ncbi:PAS domain-containing hybrid sensor histidine kinase/response regulator [Oleiagrimonas sp.]|jgi:Na+/proline symporter/signal transduction histidine kinase/ActR/RegA family two-component response regulator|uniref:hybrid sensor histidine kinase/response regulator n=1 Tax=Oleiagrimonas sp. TaxID=2010330 RepID=UPI002626D4B0|nr:PAS domain-containing hybrid sensor histidine kinase/response regulator [Oleiagrimonas sp.]MDA3914977.1 PAS domain-containing hybrid sensor histidine kinase/response regulator [Oleiagrimonas sp.]
MAGWLILVSLLYVGSLFAIAWWGDRRPLYPGRRTLRPIIYGLALAVYCSSWTFYGAVGSAAREGIGYLAIYVGPILLFVFGIRLMERLTLMAKQRNITSIADFIGARFGKSQGLAALVTLIAVTAAVPYIALQYKAVAMSFTLLAHNGVVDQNLIGDSALWCAGLLAVFAILFGTRGIDATEHHHGLMLALAVEALVKLVAFVAVGVFAFEHGPGLLQTLKLPVHQVETGLPSGFMTETLLAACAMFCLPRQFQVGVIECEHPRDIRTARWMFPLYLLIISLMVLPVVAAGSHDPAMLDGGADTWLLRLPLRHDSAGMAVLAYVGGFSAATGMVIMATLALSTMISNDLVMPALLRIRRLQLDHKGDLSSIVLNIRRVSIVLIATLAYGYYRVTSGEENLADMGLLAMAAVAQFAPAIISALYWRRASRRGVLCGLSTGFAVWTYTLLLPTLAGAGWVSQAWIMDGPLGIAWMRPQSLFHLYGWAPIVHGTFWSLLLNISVLVLVSLRYRPSVDERLNTAVFLDPLQLQVGKGEIWHGRISISDLRSIASRIVGERGTQRAFAEYARRNDLTLEPQASADRRLLQFAERLMAGAIGAAGARRMLTSALSGKGLDLAEAVALLDEASQELRFNRGLLSTALENVAHGISVVDAHLQLVMWNRRYIEIFKYPEGMIYVGRPVADLIRWNFERGDCPPQEVEENIAKRLAYLRVGNPYMFQRFRADGSVLEMRGHALPGGGYVTTYTDITVYKHAEQALIEANETLEQRVAERTAELSEALTAQELAKRAAETANQSKSRFLAAASHDLLQPLNAARLFTSALRHQPGLDEEVSRLAERIDQSFRSAEDLLEDLLDASRLDAGRYRPELEDFMLAPLFNSIQAQFAVVASQRNLELRVAPTSLAVRSDMQLLRRILQNFISNALRYTRYGGVLMGARARGDCVRIEVWDTGPGISVEKRELIFNEFQRLQEPSPWGEKGLGLGLSICERIAGILGHKLDLRSLPGHGSCFALELPRTQAQPVTPLGEPMPMPGTLNLKVLCMDNDPNILEGMTSLLARWGTTCIVARNPHEASSALQQTRVDLLLADFHLDQDEDGIDAISKLRRIQPGLPAALITADGSAELKIRARSLGIPTLHKPVKPAALRALLVAMTRGASSGGSPPAVETTPVE